MKALNFVSYSAGSPTPFVPGFNCVRAEISKIAYHRQLDVRFFPNNVRFAPESGHVQCTSACPLCPKSGHGCHLFR